MISDVPLRYRAKAFSPTSIAKQVLGGRGNLWRKLRLATLPIFFEHLGNGRFEI